MLKKIVIAAAAFAAIGSDVSLAASTVLVTATGSLNVTATVVASCSVTLKTNIVFGNVTVVPGTLAKTNGNDGAFDVTCDNGTDYAVGVGNGGFHSTTRQMAFGAQRLPYELYTDPAYTTVFTDVVVGSGVGASASSGNVGFTGTGGTQTYTVYGKIPLGTAKPLPGVYADTVVVDLVY